MEDIQEQLAALRRRIAQVQVGGTLRVAPANQRVAGTRVAATGFIHELMSGEVVRTPHGEHFETEKVWERHRRHGSVDISDLAELPEDLTVTELKTIPFGRRPDTRLDRLTAPVWPLTVELAWSGSNGTTTKRLPLASQQN